MRLNFKAAAAALLLLIASAPAHAQCGGQAEAGKFCGNPTGATGLPKFATVPAGSLTPIASGTVVGNPGATTAPPQAATMASMFDRAFCSTVGWVVAKTTGGWLCSNKIPVNAAWLGADPGNAPSQNDTAFAAAKAAASGSKSLYIPAGFYPIGVQFEPGNICTYGDGPNATVLLQKTPTANGLVINPPIETYGGCLKQLSIEAGTGWVAGGTTDVGSTGVGLTIINLRSGFSVDQVGVHNFGYGVNVSGSVGAGGAYGGVLNNIDVRYFSGTGAQIDPAGTVTNNNIGGDRFFTNFTISNNGLSGSPVGTTTCLAIGSSGGDKFINGEINGCGIGTVLSPPVGGVIGATQFVNIYNDTNVSVGMVFDGTNGPIRAVTCTACFTSFTISGPGVITKGSGLDDLQYNGGSMVNNGTMGWDHQGGTHVYARGVSINENSKAATLTSPGVKVHAAVSHWGIQNSAIGNFGPGSGSWEQTNGIEIDPSASTNSVLIQGNNLLNPGTGYVGISSSTLGTDINISNNIPASVNTYVYPVVNGGTGFSGQRATSSVAPSTPTGTSSATDVMMGLAGAITPAASGKVVISVNGAAINSDAAGGCAIQIRYGTGAAPANGAAVTGTAAGSNPAVTGVANNVSQFLSASALVTGLTPSTSYWYDLAFHATTAGTCSGLNMYAHAEEM